MFKKAFALVLLGIVVIGGLTVAYGTFYDKGFASSVSGLVGAGEDDDEWEEHDDDD
ncbi:hypothetical protein QQM79_02460 [Marinobacteraceae bacterium S3BR75-40.1]